MEDEVAVDSNGYEEEEETLTIKEYVEAEGQDFTPEEELQEEINVLQEEIGWLAQEQELDEEIENLTIDAVLDLETEGSENAEVTGNSSWNIATTKMVRSTCEHIDLGRTMHIMSFTINGRCVNHMNLHVGDTARLRVLWDNQETQCKGCVEQMYVGVRGQHLDCIFSDNQDHDTNGYYDFNTGPLTAGQYSLVATSSWQYDCVERKDGEVLATLLVEYPETPGLNSFIFLMAIVGILAIISTIFYAVQHYLNGGKWERLDINFSDLPLPGTKVTYGKEDPELERL